MTKTMNETDEVLRGMFTENTGTHMLDSGSAYGRNWEKNQGVDFDAIPEAILGFKYGMDLTLNSYHWLRSRVEYDAEMDGRMSTFADLDPDGGWMPIVEDFVSELAESGHEVTGLYGEGEPFWVNTYNHECLLSQTLQFYLFEVDGTGYVALQVHGGCDVRGGYTAPRVFRADVDGGILDYASGYISCEDSDGCGASWYTDDAWHWYASNDEPEFKTDDANEGGLCPSCKSAKLTV